jgi:hypothetical protein
MRIPWVLSLVLGCGATTGLGRLDDAAVASCLPVCLSRLFSTCAPPVGACVAYITAAPDNWRRCFDNGLVVEAQPMGAHRYRQGSRVCASYSSLGAATVAVDTWRDGAGQTIATVTRPYDNATSWTITCDGVTTTLDVSSPACANDPWVRTRNPHALPCPIEAGDACRTR